MQCIMQSYNTTWMGPWTAEGGIARPFQATVDIQLQEYGQNDEVYPYGHEKARSGENQLRPTAKDDSYIQIPANLGGGFTVAPFGRSFS